jgi:hypothetical protein
MANQNLTLAIDKEILLEARKFALEHGTTVNQLVRDYLTRLKDIEGARRSALEHFLNGPKVEIGPITWKREDLYER